ncbi:unnamed protein product [Phaedon cochleariae]|uniref:FAD dependent oxidoreductase domain-containing protein n=1 Tax=Phaedon cochleariae TaxID=80249 RepID=A0A9P0DQH5_PHACE|nr:unnamed protein product [Phaedon cochleariae]
MVDAMADPRIAVLGAGIVGVTTALQLQKTFRNIDVTIVADKFDEDTTSWVAAGIFRPGTSFTGPSEEITRKWINDSYFYWKNIEESEYGAEAGVTSISGYIFSSENPGLVRNHYIENLVPTYRQATREELKLCPGQWKYGSFFSTLLTQSSVHLPWSMKKFLSNGGKVIQRKISSLAELSENFDIIVNCTGLGAKGLCNDHILVPLRGQVIKIEAPWIKTFFYGDYDTYVIPGFDAVTLGGCRQYDSYNTSVDDYDYLSIKNRCLSLVPSLRSGRIVGNLVGLRPHRQPVRVEKEVHLNQGGDRVKIVHNYGHGGYGVTTAPGTAIYACELVREMLVGNSKI